MKKILSILLAGLMLGAFGQTLSVNERTTVVENIGGGGTLQMDGRFTSKDMGKNHFYLDFIDEAGQSVKKVRFDSEKFLDMSNFESVKYSPEMINGPDFKLKIEVSSQGTFYILLNNIPLISVSAKGDKPAKSIMAIPFFTFKPVFDNVKWENKDPDQRIFIRTGKDRTNVRTVIRKMPQELFELEYKFKVEPLAEKTGHFSFKLLSSEKGIPDVHMVFWKKGYQMIFGKNSKWLHDFATPIADGKWHVFKLRHSDADFWETYLDGKSTGSFEADLKVKKIEFGVCDSWLFEVDKITLKPIASEKK